MGQREDDTRTEQDDKTGREQDSENRVGEDRAGEDRTGRGDDRGEGMG